MSKHILVVDDNRHIRKAVCEMILRDPRLSPCSEAENGLQGVQRAATDEPDLVVMDFSMPVMNGLEAAKRIKERLPNIYIILFTLHPEILEVNQLTEFGISALVSKEQAAKDLVPAILSLLGLSAVSGAA
jgi:DNA-binding NarL/FixJ family response regulator